MSKYERGGGDTGTDGGPCRIDFGNQCEGEIVEAYVLKSGMPAPLQRQRVTGLSKDCNKCDKEEKAWSEAHTESQLSSIALTMPPQPARPA